MKAPDDLRIEREEKAGDVFTEGGLAYETEGHIDGFAVDYEVSNVGDLLHLYQQFDEIMRNLGIKGSK